MKKQGSIWMLLVHSTLYKLLAVWAVVAGVQTVLFVQAVRKASILQNSTLEGASLAMEALVAQSHMAVVFGVGLVLTALVLALIAWRDGAGLTLCRLRTTPRAVYLCHTGCAFLCFVLYWALQAVLVAALARWVGSLEGAAIGPQDFFLACWRSRFLHGLYPLMDWAVFCKNLALLGLLAVVVAHMPCPAAKRNFPKASLLVSILVAWLFPSTFLREASVVVLLLTGTALVLGVCLFGICKKEAKWDADAMQD